jgi:hypothetical protein
MKIHATKGLRALTVLPCLDFQPVGFVGGRQCNVRADVYRYGEAIWVRKVVQFGVSVAREERRRSCQCAICRIRSMDGLASLLMGAHRILGKRALLYREGWVRFM